MENKEKRKLAQMGENLAAHYLENLGYLVIRHNFHSAYGEIDIIAQDNLELVIVEVKTRTSHNVISAENSISKAKQRKLTLTAMQFLADYPDFANLSCRFDVIIVFYYHQDESFQIKHYKNAFLPDYISCNF